MVVDPDDQVIEGLTTFAELTGDVDMAKVGTMLYRPVADVLRPYLQAGEPCVLALPSMIIRSDVRAECLVAVTSSYLLVAWRKGFIRKTTTLEAIPLASITDVHVASGTTPSTRGASLMHVTGSSYVAFALPVGKQRVADALMHLLGRS